MNIERCGVTGKQMFPTKQAARGALASFARARGSKRITDRCLFCNSFHLTKGVRGKPGKAR